MSSSLYEFDVIVVGASCAGLFAAEELAREGRSVAVLERGSVETQARRTWIVTDRIREVLGEVPEPAVVHKTGVMKVIVGDAADRVVLDPPDLIVERSVLMPYMAGRARDAGARVLEGLDVRSVERADNGFGVRATERATGLERSFCAGHVIGADGAHSTVVDAMGGEPNESYPIVQAIVDLPDGYDPDVTKVWFDRESTRFFYWLIPDSPTTGAVGLVAESNRTARSDLDRFLAEHGFHPTEYQGALIPLHRPTRRIEWSDDDGRLLLVGDAAAHVKVTTVGGVVSGLWGARAAARALLQSTDYGKELRALHHELWLHDLIRWSMDRFSQEDYVRLVRMMNPRLRRILSHRNRDSMAGAWWRLLLAQPRIVGLGLKSLALPYRDGAERAGGEAEEGSLNLELGVSEAAD